ncbi:kinase-like domain-containing protein [Mycena epipterygia]|nr:kinase-like domain-containing protein [Mycena epipterygia]
MAMLHPDDEAFSKQEILSHTAISSLFNDRLGLVPTSITCPESQGSFHKVYFVSLSESDGHPWSGRDVVLRVARKTIIKTKTENEMALLDLVRSSGIPVPEVVFYCSDPNNPLGYEYNCMEKISYPSLADTWPTLSSAQLDHVLDQMVDIFIKLFSIEVPPNHGSLALNGQSGPVIEETMWQFPDIKRYFHAEPYNLTGETFATLNPTDYYQSWPAYISAFLKKYHHIISIHPAVDFLRDLLEPLQQLISKLDAADVPWVQRLRDEPALRGRLVHRDFHFGNILADHDGTIKAIIDWEFAGIGPFFAKRSSLIDNCLGFFRVCHSGPDSPPSAQVIIQTWAAEFSARLAKRAPGIAATWAHETDLDAVLGVEGKALSDVREYIRACLEVGVRGERRVELARGAWKETAEQGLKILGC